MEPTGIEPVTSPLAAIRAATLNGAYYIGMDHELDSVEEGKLAELTILPENPLDDLRNSTSIIQLNCSCEVH